MYTFMIKIERSGSFRISHYVDSSPIDQSLPMFRLQANTHGEAASKAAEIVDAWLDEPLVVTADEYLLAHKVQCQSLHLHGVTFDIFIIAE